MDELDDGKLPSRGCDGEAGAAAASGARVSLMRFALAVVDMLVFFLAPGFVLWGFVWEGLFGGLFWGGLVLAAGGEGCLL